MELYERPGRVSKWVFGDLAGSRGLLGTRVLVHGRPFGVLLDLQQCARAMILMVIINAFLWLYFSLNDFWQVLGASS